MRYLRQNGTCTFSTTSEMRDGHVATLSKQVNPADGEEVFSAFRKGMEISDTYWSARKAYLSGVNQGPTETAAELAVRI